jgi:hypothetical protein
VQRIPGGPYCTIAHFTPDGREHTVPWERCEAPTRWTPAPVGSQLHCFYFVSAPSDIFFAPRTVAWATPARLALLALGVVLGIIGVAVGVRARLRPVAPASGSRDVTAGPYRAGDPPPPEEPRAAVAPLRVALWSSSGVLRKTLGTAAGVVGLTIVALSASLAGEASGDVSFAYVGLPALGLSVTFAALLAIGFRSGLVLDRERGDLHSWWGLWRPWFRRHHALSCLRAVDVRVTIARRMRTKELELRFEDGAARTFACDDVDGAVAKIREYLAVPQTTA